ncbi:MAG TPA: porin family protein [Candidatus Cloacimonadota bacterium]|nr:porin family protein [Candidatus Cloacimonadota bacterium]
MSMMNLLSPQKHWLPVLLFLVSFASLSAKSIPREFGLRLGMNLAQHYAPKLVDQDFAVDPGIRPGFATGVYMNYLVLPELRLGYEVLYSQKGSREKITIYSMDGEDFARPAVMNVEYDLDYLEIPVLLRLHTDSWDKLSLEGITGTAMGLKIHSHHKLRGKVYLPSGDDFDEIPISEESDLAGVNQFDFSFVYGAGVNYTGKVDLSAEFRFVLGWDYLELPTFSLSDPVKLRNQTYSLLLGLKF